MPNISSRPHGVLVHRCTVPADRGRQPLYVVGDDGAASPDGGAVRLASGASVSFQAPLNIFPAAYWQHHTDVRAVRLQLDLSAPARIRVVRSDSRGVPATVSDERVEAGRTDVIVDLAGFDGGGHLWFEVDAGVDGCVVEAGWWAEATIPPESGGVSVAIATFNRPGACVTQLRTLARAVDGDALIHRIVVVDQGDRRVEDDPGFAEVAAALGDRLLVIRQPNLGGSGGFTRAAMDGLSDAATRFILLLDDDAVPDAQALFRATRFAQFTRVPSIVGGAMYHTDPVTMLYAQGERWNPLRSWMRPASSAGYDVDFRATPLSRIPALHERVDSDYSGWWFCLVPVETLRSVGLPLPLFLKFDDVEFGLRAAESGVPTVVLPGVAVWHEAWAHKDPTRTWEGFFILRNQIVTGMLHSGRRFGGVLPIRTLLGDLQLLLRLQYAAVRLRHEAVRSALRPPDELAASIGHAQSAVRALRENYLDGRVVADAQELLSSALPTPARPAPRGPLAAALRATGELLRHLVRRPDPDARATPDVVLSLDDAQWWRFEGADAALVEAPGGAGWTLCERDRELTRRFAWRSAQLAWQLSMEWGRTSQRYRSAVPGLSSEESWRRIFAANGATPAVDPTLD